MRRRFFIIAAPVVIIVAFWHGAARADAASLSFSPSSGTYSAGDTIVVTVRVNTGNQAMNAAEGTVAFSTDTLQFVSVSKSGSIFKYWTTEPSGSNTGRVVFGGGLPRPGYTGSSGTLVRVTFRARTAGTASLSFRGGRVLANDGVGTNILTSTGTASFAIREAAAKPPAPKPTEEPPPAPSEPARPTPSVSSSSHPDQNAWYTTDHALLSWTMPAGAQGVSYQLSHDATVVPDELLEPSGTNADLILPVDGVWYFLLRAKYTTGWSTVGRYALRRDSAAPEPFTLDVLRDRGITDPTPALQFIASDATSGVQRYTLSLDGGEVKDVTSPATLQLEETGTHRVTVVAYDAAGNSQEASAEFTFEGYPPPIITFVSSPRILLDTIEVRGTAHAGDVVTVFVDGELLGSVTLETLQEGEDAQTRRPWRLASDRVFRPGTHDITATATNTDGQQSVATDAVTLKIIGTFVRFFGRPIATVAVAPLALFVSFGLLLTLIAALTRVALLLHSLQRRRSALGDAVRRLRLEFARGHVSAGQVESALERLESEGRKPRRAKTRKSSSA